MATRTVSTNTPFRKYCTAAGRRMASPLRLLSIASCAVFSEPATRYSRFKPASFVLLFAALFLTFSLSSCGVAPAGDPELNKRTYLELVDWHISGFWVINSPVAWVRVANYNQVPITDITLQYNTFDADGKPLDEGTFTVPDGQVVAPGATHNFIELYLGFVSLHTEKLSIKLLSVRNAQ